MTEAFHSRTIHNKAVQNVAHEAISQVGPMPQEPSAAGKWKRKVERIIQKLHERYKDDWEKAFEADQALKLTLMAGRELGKRELQASKSRRRSVPRSVADVSKEIFEPEVKVETAKVASETPTRTRLESATMPRMPSMPTMPSMLQSDVRADAGSKDKSLAMSNLGQRGLSLLQRPWVTLGIGLVVGFVVGNCIKCWLSSRA